MDLDTVGVVSGVGRGMGVLDGYPRVPRGRGSFGGFSPPLVLMAFLSVFLKQKCIRLLREKLTILCRLNGGSGEVEDDLWRS